MADLYHDAWITCTQDSLVIRWYYLWGPRRVPYSNIKSVRRVDLTPLRGKMRIWGTSNPHYWASLDPVRPGKDAALILDTGGVVKAFITPDDVDAVAEIIKERAGLADILQTSGGPFLL